MSAIQHLSLHGSPTWVVIDDDGAAHLLACSLAELLAEPGGVRARLDAALAGSVIEVGDAVVLPPVDVQEVWAAGVTYKRSRDGRMEEATDASPYDRVYDAPRPEVFLKATAGRVVTDGDDVGIRADSGWDVPEPELGLVLDAAGGIVGYVVGNDMSSRSIEGANMLYLPQAKFYDRACALGGRIVPAWEIDAAALEISVTIERDDVEVFSGTTSTDQLHRSLEDLAAWLYRGVSFPHGAVLLTGTGIVPDVDFTLREDDVVSIAIERVGTLRNRVVVVGSGAFEGEPA